MKRELQKVKHLLMRFMYMITCIFKRQSCLENGRNSTYVLVCSSNRMSIRVSVFETPVNLSDFMKWIFFAFC